MPRTLTLPEKLDTAVASFLLADLLAARGDALILDAAGCRSIGAICAQIIISAHNAWQADGHAFVLQGHAGIANDLTLLGLSDFADALETQQ